MLKHVDRSNFENEVIKSNKVILVDFFATWCPPCKMLSPVLEKIASSRAEFDVAKVNIDENNDIAGKYNIEVVPTMLVFKEGKVVDKMVGYMNENDITNTVSKYI
jgi:thioredoxin 1